MPAPTNLEVYVDNTEYSRYETALDRINVSLAASGGAPSNNVPIRIDLIKARRERNSAIASDTVFLNGMIDPVSATTSFYLPDIVDQDHYNLARHGSYFVRATYEGTSATATVGSGINGTVNVFAPIGEEGNSFFVEVVDPGGTSPLTIDFNVDTLTISLATVGGVVVASMNTAATIATAITSFGTTNEQFYATYTGNGSDSITVEGPNPMSGGTNVVEAITPDFAIRIVSVARFKRDWLFGLPLYSTQVLQVKQGPSNITGVSIIEISEGNSPGFGELSYNITNSYPSNATALIGAGANGTVQIEADGTYQGQAGNSFSVQVNVPATGTSPLTTTLVGNTVTVSLAVTAGVLNNSLNTATLVAGSISALPNFTGTPSGTGADPIVSAQTKTNLTGGVTTTVRTLSWKGGPAITVQGPGTYVLPGSTNTTSIAGLLGCSGNSLKGLSKDYIVVKVASLLSLPTTSTSDLILLDRMQFDDETLARYLDEAIAYLENDFLNVYLEPTVVVTDTDPQVIQFAAGVNAATPIFTNPDWDKITGPLTYYIPTNGGWLDIQMPFMGLLRVDSLFGAVANTRVIDIDLDWIQHYHKGGFVQLVPYSQATAFNYLGLLWVNALRGAVEVPNFWHFIVLAGLRDAPPELQEFVGKLAAINALTALAAAFRPGLGSMSLSRDGVSQSLSFNTQATYGIYTGAIQSYKDWIKERQAAIKANYKGATMVVC